MTIDREQLNLAFLAHCRDLRLPLPTCEIAWTFALQEVKDFEMQERELGHGKTRRPSFFSSQFFQANIDRAQEMERRQREDNDGMLGGE
jgi:hypothetical protein